MFIDFFKIYSLSFLFPFSYRLLYSLHLSLYFIIVSPFFLYFSNFYLSLFIYFSLFFSHMLVSSSFYFCLLCFSHLFTSSLLGLHQCLFSSIVSLSNQLQSWPNSACVVSHLFVKTQLFIALPCILSQQNDRVGFDEPNGWYCPENVHSNGYAELNRQWLELLVSRQLYKSQSMATLARLTDVRNSFV